MLNVYAGQETLVVRKIEEFLPSASLQLVDKEAQ